MGGVHAIEAKSLTNKGVVFGKVMEELDKYLEGERYERAFESILKDIEVAKTLNDYDKVKRLIKYLMSIARLLNGETEQKESILNPSKNIMIYCSFCGKGKGEVLKMIAGPSVFICNECIGLCQDILHDEGIDHKRDE